MNAKTSLRIFDLKKLYKNCTLSLVQNNRITIFRKMVLHQSIKKDLIKTNVRKQEFSFIKRLDFYKVALILNFKAPENITA